MVSRAAPVENSCTHKFPLSILSLLLFLFIYIKRINQKGRPALLQLLRRGLLPEKLLLLLPESASDSFSTNTDIFVAHPEVRWW